MVRKAVLSVCVLGLAAGGAGLGGCASSAKRSGHDARFDDGVTDYLTSVRIDLVEGKTDLINDLMNLSPNEAEVFWEIYSEYESEYFALGERRRGLERELSERTLAGTLNDDSAARLARAFLELRREMLDLLTRYHARISAELSPIRGAQFLQIEHRTGTVVDLVVASQMPLIGGR